MEILRTVKGFSLNKGNGAANGLYNVTNDELVKRSSKGVSNWFDTEDKDVLMKMNDDEFVKACANYLK